MIALEIERSGGLAQHLLAFYPVHILFGGEQAVSLNDLALRLAVSVPSDKSVC